MFLFNLILSKKVPREPVDGIFKYCSGDLDSLNEPLKYAYSPFKYCHQTFPAEIPADGSIIFATQDITSLSSFYDPIPANGGAVIYAAQDISMLPRPN